MVEVEATFMYLLQTLLVTIQLIIIRQYKQTEAMDCGLPTAVQVELSFLTETFPYLLFNNLKFLLLGVVY